MPMGFVASKRQTRTEQLQTPATQLATSRLGTKCADWPSTLVFSFKRLSLQSYPATLAFATQHNFESVLDDYNMTLSGLRFLASDVFLAGLIPLLILLFGFRHLPSLADLRSLFSLQIHKTSPALRHHGTFSLERAYASLTHYARLSAAGQATMRASYARLGRTGKRVGYAVGYPAKLDRLKDTTARNAVLTDGIAECALEDFPDRLKNQSLSASIAGPADLGRVREAMKHFVRDWSEEGRAERTRIFEPILDFLRTVKQEDRETMRVLVPGCGLGRLAWEISELGYDTTANELSFFMTLAFRFVLSPKHTKSLNEHILRPYAHWFSHQRTNDSLFRAISFPDALPRLSPRFHLLEEDFLKLPIPSAKSDTTQRTAYDFIVTLFFIDTSLDIFATLSHIFSLLRPGGTWINLGPLLWTSGGQASAELNLEEVLQAAEEIGFVIDKSEGGPAARRTVECEYTSDKQAMMRWIYMAEYWVARKPL